MDSGRHKLSENWFVWSKRSYSGDKVGCHPCPRTTEREVRARILKQNSQIVKGFHKTYISVHIQGIIGNRQRLSYSYSSNNIF